MAQEKKIINVFATQSDWQKLLSGIEEQLAIYYVRGGSQSALPGRVETHEKLESLGFANSGNANTEASYLCFCKNTAINIRSVEQRNGTRVNFIDQQTNPDTIAIKIGGKFGSHVIVAGQIGTISDSDWSLRAYSTFKKEICKQFEKVKSYYVGEEAHNLLRAGWRLTANVRAPGEYDLSL
jgi:hypothetical protein